MLCKMGEYCERANAAAQLPPVPVAQGSSNMPVFMNLAAQYGLEDDDLGFGIVLLQLKNRFFRKMM
jgi:hypothetical protein